MYLLAIRCINYINMKYQGVTVILNLVDPGALLSAHGPKSDPEHGNSVISRDDILPAVVHTWCISPLFTGGETASAPS